MRLRILHTIRYRYPTPAPESHHEVRMMPLSDDDQTCLDFRLTLSPPSAPAAYDLPSGRVHYFDTYAAYSELLIRAESLVITHRQNPFLLLPSDDKDGEFYRRATVQQAYGEFLSSSPQVRLHPEADRIAAVAHRKASGAGTVPFLMALLRQLYRAATFSRAAKGAEPPLRPALYRGERAETDFAHLMIAVCRRQGIPARFVSGYRYTGDGLRTAAAGAEERHGGREAPLDAGVASAMNAWVECLLPDSQWHGFDPANNLLTNDHFVKAHTGRDGGDVAPVRSLNYSLSVYSVESAIRVTVDPV